MKKLKDANIGTVYTHTGIFREIKSKNQYSDCKAIVFNDGSFLVGKRGITLIALIITIIVLLILAGVTINMLLGDNGIIKRAGEAGEEYANKQAAENEILSEAEQMMQNYIGTLRNGESSNIDPETKWDLDKVEIYNDSGYKVPIPKELEYIEGTKDTGIVVRDTITLNEFVWVPALDVPYQRAILVQGFGTIAIYDEPDYVSAYSDSVTHYGGFYLARYEAGCQVERTLGSTELPIPLFKKNEFPYNYVSYDEARTLCRNLYNTSANIVSDLQNSYVWDTTLLWIESKTGADVRTDSSSWGNYSSTAYSVSGKFVVKMPRPSLFW